MNTPKTHPKQKICPEMYAQIIQYRKDGYSWNKIAKKYRCSQQLIHRHKKRMQLDGTPKGRCKITKEEILLIQKRVEESGYVLTSKIFGYARSTIRDAFKFYGIDCKSFVRKMHSEKQIQEIRRLYYYGYTQSYIANAYGCCASTISQIVKNEARLTNNELIARSEMLHKKYPYAHEKRNANVCAVLSRNRNNRFWAYLGDI